MERLTFDTGLAEYEMNGHAVLRFNPSDLNVYARFSHFAKEIADAEEKLVADAKDKSTVEQLALLEQADRDMKVQLANIFGTDNDIDAIFDGVNVMAVGRNGERVITNFFAALMPIMERGQQMYAEEKATAAVEQASQNRAQRRAAAKNK